MLLWAYDTTMIRMWYHGGICLTRLALSAYAEHSSSMRVDWVVCTHQSCELNNISTSIDALLTHWVNFFEIVQYVNASTGWAGREAHIASIDQNLLTASNRRDPSTWDIVVPACTKWWRTHFLNQLPRTLPRVVRVLLLQQNSRVQVLFYKWSRW